MFKSQTSRNNFLQVQAIAFSLTLFTICAPAYGQAGSNAQASRCEGLFSGPATTQTLETYLSRTAETSSAAAYADALLAETARPVVEHSIYRQAIAPALWNYVRLTLEASTAFELTSPTAATVPRTSSDPMTRLLNGITESAVLERARTRPIGDAHIRPKAMTRDEQDLVRAVGHYGLIDGGRIPSPKSREARQRDAIQEMILQAQRAYSKAPTAQPSRELVRLEFERLQRERPAGFTVSKAELDAVIASPSDFAIVYAQLGGLTARSGTHGEALSPFVPWMRPSSAPEKFRALYGLVILAQALHPAGEARRQMDNTVLETLRREFAPHLEAKEFLP